MTRILYYTDGATAGSISGGAPLPFGTAQARPVTMVGVYDAIVAAFVAAGWTQRNQTTRDDVFTSAGENGFESINVRIRWDGVRYIYFYVGTKTGPGAGYALQGDIGGGTNAYERWDILGGDAAWDYAILATKDFLLCSFRFVANNNTYSAYLGNLERDNIVNPNVLFLSGVVSPGDNVVVPVTGDPIASDYRPGDQVMIVGVDENESARAQVTQLVDVTTTSVTVANLALSYATLDRIGANPCPVARFVGGNTEPWVGTNWYTPLQSAVGYPNTSCLGAQLLNQLYWSTGAPDSGFGSGTTPNKRTRRFTCRQLSIGVGGADSIGRIAGLYGYPGSMSYYPNDTGTYNRITPNQRFLGVSFTSANNVSWMVGKAP